MRNIEQLRSDYDRMLEDRPGLRSTFDLEDVEGIMKVSGGLPECISTALKVGYMVGYQTAQREVKSWQKKTS